MKRVFLAGIVLLMCIISVSCINGTRQNELSGAIVDTEPFSESFFVIESRDPVENVVPKEEFQGQTETSDVGKVSVTEGVPNSSSAAEEYDFVLNTNSRKFHYPTCSSVSQTKDKNKDYYKGTREELLDMGYDSCGRCKP